MNEYHKRKELLEMYRCRCCSGAGTLNDAEPGDIGYSTWTCPVCQGSGMSSLLNALNWEQLNFLENLLGNERYGTAKPSAAEVSEMVDKGLLTVLVSGNRLQLKKKYQLSDSALELRTQAAGASR